MKMTFEYAVCTTRTFNIPKSGIWHDFFEAWLKDDEDRTDKDWNILENYSIAEFIETTTNEEVVSDSIALYDYEK